MSRLTRPDASEGAPPRSARRGPLASRVARVALPGLALLALYTGTYSQRRSTDAHLNLLQSRALALHGDVDLSRYGPQPGFTRRRGERIYSTHGVGVSVVTFPYYAIVSRTSAGTQTQHGIPASLFATGATLAMFRLLLRRFPPWIAAGGAVIHALGTTMWPTASTALWQHAPAALFLSLGLLALFSDRPSADTAAGFLFGMAGFVRPPLLAVAAVMTIFQATRGWGPAVRFTAGALAPIAGILVQNRVLWGAWLRSGHTLVDASFDGNVAEGLWGQLFGWWRGVFVYSPALALFAAGAVIAVREPDRELRRRLIACAGATVLTLLLYARWSEWWGGTDQYAYRFALDVAPMMVLLMAYAAAARPVIAATVASFGALSVAIMALGVQPDLAGWDRVPFPDTPAAAPIGRAWDAFVSHPGRVTLSLAAAAAVFAVFMLAARDESTARLAAEPR